MIETMDGWMEWIGWAMNGWMALFVTRSVLYYLRRLQSMCATIEYKYLSTHRSIDVRTVVGTEQLWVK